MDKPMMISDEQTVRALVIEDHDLMRLSLINELKRYFRSCIVLGAATWETAAALMAESDFDLVITDPGLPGFDPTAPSHRLAVIREAVEACPRALHVVITGSDKMEEGLAAQKLGANAYIAKTGLDGDRLVAALQRISEEGFYISLSEIPNRPPEYHYSALTPREQDIIDYMRRRSSGVKRKDIYESMGERFGIDPYTVEKYYKQARAKLLRNGVYPKGA
ncbi:response regulator transcription factor [Mycobacterium sp. KBS0706]|nr:response regulator transcription factor [Mycobacterium sp. KBS0706]